MRQLSGGASLTEQIALHLGAAEIRHHRGFRFILDAFGNHRGVAFLYFAAMLFLGLHVSHGFGSMFQTLGVSHPKYHAALRKASPVFAVLIVLGFVSVPLAVLLGIVKPAPGGF